MPTVCDITFNNTSGTYYGGQCISGTARLVTTNSKTIRGIHITVFGRAKVLWNETRSSGKNTVKYTASETYLNSRAYVIGCESGPTFDLSPGTYNYNFSCHLPPLLPTSFLGDYGTIKYYVKLTIDRPCRFDNEFKLAFNVIYNLNLNFDANLRVPIHVDDRKTFGLWCCESGPLKMSLSTPMTGYVPGQSIHFTCLVENESSNDIEEIVAGVKQDVQYTSDYPHKKTNVTRRTVTKKIIGSSLKYSKKEFCDLLELPAVPQSTQNTCSIIEISYYLYAKAKGGVLSTDLLLKISITIGCIPIANSEFQGERLKMLQSPTLDNFQIGSGNPAPPPPGFMFGIDSPQPAHGSTINPPSYCDTMSKNQAATVTPSDESGNSEMSLVQKYPTYNKLIPAALPK